jgi:response regulator RpfG family c-di-GMP phosphodiesterase
MGPATGFLRTPVPGNQRLTAKCSEGGIIMVEAHARLQQLLEINQELEQVKDLDALLERILRVARRFVNADAGSIYTINASQLEFRHAQNTTLQQQLPPGKKLVYTAFTLPISHRSIAGYVALTGETLTIPDVYTFDFSGTPYSFDRSYDEKGHYQTHSMLTIPLKNNQNKVIGVMQLINAQNEAGQVVPFSEEDTPFIRIFATNAAVAIERAQMTRTMILRMISMAELRDPKETGPHVNRVAAYASEIYEKWALKRDLPSQTIDTYKDMLRMTAMLHDVGKVGVKDEILQKPGRLTPDEYEMMKLHTVKGAKLFDEPQSEFEQIAGHIALNHHERWDGSGYPGHVNVRGKPLPGYANENGKARGKCGEEIPLFARIVAVADVYDALSCRRVYKNAWNEEEVLIELRNESGKHFDPDVIDAFFATLDVIRVIAKQFPDQEKDEEDEW